MDHERAQQRQGLEPQDDSLGALPHAPLRAIHMAELKHAVLLRLPKASCIAACTDTESLNGHLNTSTRLQPSC